MWVCGRNNYGQLGNGKHGITQISKEFVKLDTNVVKIGAGEGYFIYLKKMVAYGELVVQTQVN